MLCRSFDVAEFMNPCRYDFFVGWFRLNSLIVNDMSRKGIPSAFDSIVKLIWCRKFVVFRIESAFDMEEYSTKKNDIDNVAFLDFNLWVSL